MSELSFTSTERSRKAHSLFLQAMEERGTAKNVALAMACSEATVSRTKDQMEAALALLYQVGFKVVEASRVCVQHDKYAAMVTLARAAMADDATVQKLIWDESA